MDIDNLFKQDLSKCQGCSILGQPLSRHAIMDYEDQKEREVLFVSDSLKLCEGDYIPFRMNEWNLITREVRKLAYNKMVGFTAAVKCPHIKKEDMSAKNRKICRTHLESTILQYKPKLVFACGSLATMMIYGKNVDDKKARGKAVDFEMAGHKFRLVSIFHPYQVIAEPKNAYLFSLDIENNINAEILGIKKESGFSFTPIFSLDDLAKVSSRFLDTEDPIAVDIETTGLNFLDESIQTISMSVLSPDGDQLTIVIPIDHKENTQGLYFKAKVCSFIANVMRNKRNRKILQNANFDLKFLKKYGIEEDYNEWDTKIMQHTYNEDVPKALRDLVSYYFPNESI